MIKMTLNDVKNLIQAQQEVSCQAQGSIESTVFEGVSTDTRTLKPGNLFVAITGEQFDGNAYIQEAFKKGAAAALVSKTIDCPLPQFQVNDTLLALGHLTRHWRNQFTLPLVGVTGSNGKTTLKNMIASIMRAASHNDAASVLATEGNLNNNIGVPLNLARLNAQHRYSVIEMGMNHFGEIEYLTKLAQPTVAVINNAAEGHLEGLKDIAGVARAKGEIFLGLSKDGTAVLNRDDDHYHYWQGITAGHPQLSFGLDHPADVTATLAAQQPDPTKQLFSLSTPKGKIDVSLPLLGIHNIRNALAAAAAALAVDINLDSIKAGLEFVAPAPGRMNQHLLANGLRVIDDTYNANPFSTRAAITTLAKFNGTKILVLGDMRELGPQAKEMHFETGEIARQAGIDHLFTLGELTAATTQAFGEKAHHFTDRAQLITALQPYLKANTTVLIKGSRSMHMEKVVAGIIPDIQLAHAH